MRKIIPLILMTLFVGGCATSRKTPLAKCRTYFTLSADRKKLIWNHECPTDVKHLLWTAEREIHVDRWYHETKWMSVAFGENIRIPRHPSNPIPKEATRKGVIACTKSPDRIKIDLYEIEPSGKVHRYRRNGEYELRYEQNP